MKKLLLSVSGAISFVIFLILLAVTTHMGNSQDSQQMASRWSREERAAQISCFFSPNANITIDTIEEFEHSVDNFLKESSITLDETEHPGARLWADAYSADGKVQLTNEKTSLEADAIGIGGDFFLFHPLKLLAGGYFSGNDLNHDYCVIDEDAAWQLFGSNDVVGMTVYIGQTPHVVVGVVERPQGRLEEAAGLDSTLVYVSYQTLTEFGQSNGINHYEIVMPNPVSNFALNHVRESLATGLEKETEVLENTSRYSLLNKLKLVGAFGTRSMNGKAIIYPFWENIARGYEDILALLTVFQLLFLLYPIVLVLVFFIKWWKHKGWTLKDIRNRVKDKAERRMEKIRANRGRKQEKVTAGKSIKRKTRNLKKHMQKKEALEEGSQREKTAGEEDRKEEVFEESGRREEALGEEGRNGKGFNEEDPKERNPDREDDETENKVRNIKSES